LIEVHVVLRQCREVELTAARLYTLLAEIHAAISEMAYIWRKTANEEHNHAAQFEFAINNMEGSPQAVEIDTSFLENCFTALNLACEEVRTRPPTPTQALRATIVAEKAMEALHMNCISVFRDSTLKTLYNRMMAADRAHIGTLERYLEKITGESATQTPTHSAPAGRSRRMRWRSSQ
jgi:rubrerythrin